MPYYFHIMPPRSAQTRMIVRPLVLLAASAAVLAGCGDDGRQPPIDKPPSVLPKITQFTSAATMVKRGETVELSYLVQDADTVEIAPDVLPPTTVLQGSTFTPPLEQTTTFVLTARSSVGQVTRSLTITVGTSSEVEITGFTATPTITVPGGQVTLAWTTERATRVSLGVDGGANIEPNAPLMGMRIVNPTDSVTYLLTAEGPGGPKAARVTIAVGKTPTIESFTATPDEIDAQQVSTLAWDVRGAATIAVMDDTGAVVTQTTEDLGSVEVTPAVSTEYTLVATNPVGSVMDRATVRVRNGQMVQIDQFIAAPLTLMAPGNVDIQWATTAADTVTLTAQGQPVAGFNGAADGMMTVAVQSTTRFELAARGAGGSTAMRDLTVTVQTQTDTTPPVITHQPIVATQTAGLDVSIAAQITDPESGVGSVTLFYRTSGTPLFASVMMSDGGGGAYAAVIPGAIVVEPAVDYYIQASDGAFSPNVGRDPMGAPAQTHGFSVVGADRAPPQITHTTIADGQLAGTAVTVEATIVDAGSGVNTAALFYRVTGAASFLRLDMTAGAAGAYSAEIPATAVIPPSVEYYIAATDGASPANTATQPAGAPASVTTFTVTQLDTAAPIITHTPVADGQTAGGDVVIIAEVTDPSGVGTVTLFYRTSGAGAFSSLAMTGGGDERRATIPGASVQAPGVDYYVQAADAAMTPNTGTAPAGAPGTTHSFTVLTVDSNGPTIVHTPITGTRAPGGALVIGAEITDASGVASATLMYRTTGAGMFTSLAMTGGPMYSASIPASAVASPGVEYYLVAVDSAAAANSAAHPAGAPATVHGFAVGTVEVEPNDTIGGAVVLLGPQTMVNVGVGALSPAADVDWWAIDVPAGGSLFNVDLEITAGGAASCPAPIDTVLFLVSSDGTTVRVSDSFDGVGNCARIRAADDTGARALAAGRYYVRVEESGNNAVVAAYEIRGRMFATACGNGILESAASEQCDDGNSMGGDGCSATCTIEPEGTVTPPSSSFAGDISPAGDSDIYAVDLIAGQSIRAEVSDGAGACPGDLVLDLLDGDGVTILGTDDDDGIGACPLVTPGVDPFATDLAAGRYFVRVRAATQTTVNGYTLVIDVVDAICGNNAVESGEQCDDGNTTDGDGCSSTCQYETAGTAMGAGASFMGAISPAGNVDYYAVVIQAGDSIKAETFAPTDGQCASADTVIRLLESDRATQVASDDQGGMGSCSLLDPASDLEVRNLAAGTYYLTVEDYLNNGVIAAYVLNVEIIGGGCGNGWLDGADQCDDGNTMDGDGCSATCQFEGAAEMEPNDSTGTATVLLTGTTTVGRIYGSLSSASDVDIYSVMVPAGYHLFAEITDGNGGCPNDGNLRLRDGAGTSLVQDTSDGPGSCGRISPESDVAARGLAAGLYYLEVTGSGGSSAYVLDVQLLAPGCGDRFLDMGEQCDDGNTASGDGCSATCQLEGNSEIEPNDGTATATPLITDAVATPVASVWGVVMSSTDDDVFSVVVPAGYHIRAEITDGFGGCANDGNLRLLSSAGAELSTDVSDGPGSCGRISPGGNTSARGVAGGTYYLEVAAANNQTAAYQLQVWVAAENTCGNFFLDSGEVCDDGNAAAGDGCSDTCQLERSEMEANDDAASANMLASEGTIGGSVNSAGDDDWYAVTIAAGGSITAFTHTGAFDTCDFDHDTVVELYGPDTTTVVAEDDDDGPSLCSTIDRSEASNLAAGTYYVRVRPYSSTRTFDYQLTVDIE